MIDNTQELDEVLELLHNSWLEDDYNPKDPDAIEANQAIQAHIDKRVNEVLDRVDEEVIGEYERVYKTEDKDYLARLIARNRLKSDQRQAIKKLRSEL